MKKYFLVQVSFSKTDEPNLRIIFDARFLTQYPEITWMSFNDQINYPVNKYNIILCECLLHNNAVIVSSVTAEVHITLCTVYLKCKGFPIFFFFLRDLPVKL